MCKATSSDATARADESQTTPSGIDSTLCPDCRWIGSQHEPGCDQSPVQCPSWCVQRGEHNPAMGAPLCLGRSDRVVLSTMAHADDAPTIYGLQVLGSDSPRIALDRGDHSLYELTVSEATRLAQALLAAVEEVTGR